jgi:hypothetical protein
MGARICVEREVGGIVAVTPVAVEVWMSSWWNGRSTSFQRAPRVPRVRRKYTEGVGRFDDVMGA